jgi:hypothetical protein
VDCDGKRLLRVFPKVNPSVVDFAHPMRNRITNFGDTKKNFKHRLSLDFSNRQLGYMARGRDGKVNATCQGESRRFS